MLWDIFLVKEEKLEFPQIGASISKILEKLADVFKQSQHKQVKTLSYFTNSRNGRNELLHKISQNVQNYER